MKDKKLLLPLIFLAVGCVMLAVGLLVDPIVYKSLINTTKSFLDLPYHKNEFAWCIAYMLRLLGAAAAVNSFFGLFLQKRLEGICLVKTSLVAVGISGFVGSGLLSAMAMVGAMLGSALENRNMYPVQAPAAFLGGFISLLGVISLGWLYYFLRSKNKSKKGTLFDAVTAFLFVPGFFCFADAVWQYLICMFSGR